jgi:hypothetical protein
MKVLHKNLDNLLTLCQRHPANIPALVIEIEWKLSQDNYLLTTIRDKLWEHRLEKQVRIRVKVRVRVRVAISVGIPYPKPNPNPTLTRC